MIHCDAEDSRHGISMRGSDGLFGYRPSSIGFMIEGCEPEQAAFIAGRGA
jgi:hypothetical protein